MATEDKMSGHEFTLNAPAHRWAVITPHDTNKLAEVPKAIHLGGTVGGVGPAAVTCVDKDGNVASFYMKQGDTLPIRPHIIKSTGTTASAVIIALY